MILNIIIALLVFGLIVLIHELGHFLLAKKNGVTVVEFSIGMGPRLLSFTKNETKYSIKALPIGGSCMMLGEDENSQEEGAFNNKSVWARISVIAAGPIFNFILAFVLSIIMIGSIGYDAPQLGDVMDGFPAKEAGLQAGDRIRKINDKKVVVYRDITMYLYFNPGDTLDVMYERDGETYETTIIPMYSEEHKGYLMGILGGSEYVKGSVFEVLKYSAYEVIYNINMTIKSVTMLVTGKLGSGDLSGPIGIVGVIGGAVEASKPLGLFAVFINLVNLCILLSANLGVMNLLPLPALDGGRLVFLFIEAVRGKPVNREKEGLVHVIGLVCLMLLMVFVMYNDIRRLF